MQRDACALQPVCQRLETLHAPGGGKVDALRLAAQRPTIAQARFAIGTSSFSESMSVPNA
jgi:hypothetical protein